MRPNLHFNSGGESGEHNPTQYIQLNDPMTNTQEQIKIIGDAGALGVTITTFLGWLPHIAAAASIIWTVIRIYETETVQKWIAKWKSK